MGSTWTKGNNVTCFNVSCVCLLLNSVCSAVADDDCLKVGKDQSNVSANEPKNSSSYNDATLWIWFVSRADDLLNNTITVNTKDADKKV